MLNVNPDEIAKFDAIAKDWWDPNGTMKPLHLLNPLRLQYIQDHASIKQKTVLDVGCGGGILTESLAKADANVAAIDLSEAALTVAKQHAEQQQLTINYQLCSIENFASQHPAYFDVITCMELLEHVPNPKSVINACAHAVKPGGMVFFSTINRTMKAYAKAIIAAEYVLNLLPRGTHHYDQLIRPKELAQWAEDCQLTLKNLTGMSYLPLSGTFALSHDVSVNYLMCLQKR